MRDRWGDSDAYEESARRVASYGEEQWRAIKAQEQGIEHRAGAPLLGIGAGDLTHAWFAGASGGLRGAIGDTPAGILSPVNQRLTRRVGKLVDAGAVSDELLAAAGHEADLLGHPYVGVEHLRLGRLAIEGRRDDRAALRATQAQGVRRRWWRPRGPRSALRRRGLRQTESRRVAAEREQENQAGS